MVRAIRKAGLLRSCNKITHANWSSLRTSIYNRDLLLGRASTWEHALLIQAWPIEWTKLAVTSCYTHVWWYGYFLRGVNFMSTIDDIHRLPCGSHVCMSVWCIYILFFGRVHYVLLVRFSTTRRINQIKTLASSMARSALAHSYWSAARDKLACKIGTWWSLLNIHALQVQTSM